jgi:hypothetical protein
MVSVSPKNGVNPLMNKYKVRNRFAMVSDGFGWFRSVVSGTVAKPFKNHDANHRT